MSEALKAGGCRAPDGRRARRAVRGSRVSSPLSAVRARSSRVVRASSRTLLARCSNAARAQFARCSNAARVVFARCSHSQFALLIFKLGWLVACEFAPVVCTLFARCSCAVRALFARCSCAVCASANSPANYATRPSAARHTRCLPHAWPQSHSHSHRRLVHHGGAHKHHGQHRGRPWLASPGSGQAMWGCCFGIEGGGARAGWGHSISPCRAAAAAACRRRAPAKGRRAAGGRRCHAQPACFRFGVAGVSVLALRWKDAAPGRVGAIQFLHAKPLLLRAAGGHQQRAGELRGGNAAAFG